MSEFEPKPGDVLNGTYRLERCIGKGGFGSVFQASHVRLPRRFAVKFLNAEVSRNDEILDRFRREAEIASALGHENIVEVLDFNHTGEGVPYMVLEFLDGEDLSDRLSRAKKMTLSECYPIVRQVASGLAAAHARGIVHRDLKPANIFLCRREQREDLVKVLDFGISKILHAANSATRTGQVFGTVYYMSPEQAMGHQSEIDARTDVFALGAICYECLSGRLAFDGPTAVGVLFNVCHTEPPLLRALGLDVPEAVDRVIQRAMAKAREARFADASEFLRAFVHACAGVVEYAPEAVLARLATQVALDPTDRPPPLPASSPMGALGATAGTQATLDTAAPLSTTSAPTLPAKSKALTLGAVALVAGAVAFGVRASMTSSSAPKLASKGETSAPSASPPAPRLDASVPVGTSTPPGSSSESAPSNSAAAPASSIAITLVVSPLGATVLLDGAPTTAGVLPLARDGRAHRIEVSAPGYTPQSRDVVADIDRSVTIALARPVAPLRSAAPATKRPAGPMEKSL